MLRHLWVVAGTKVNFTPDFNAIPGAAFALILVGAALIPAPVRAGEALDQSAAEPESATLKPA